MFTGIQKKFFECEDKLINLIKTWDEGKILREGLTISIIGKPNAENPHFLTNYLVLIAQLFQR